MIDEYMKRYREQMNEVTLSDSADQAIMDDLLKADVQKGGPYMKRTKRNISAAIIAIVIVIASSATVVAIRGAAVIKSNKEERRVEGVGAKVNLGESYYYDLLAGDNGEIYALTDNDAENELTDYHVVVWKSTDQGDTWESVLLQPDELKGEIYLSAGDLREGKDGIEAVVMLAEEEEKTEDGYYIWRVYQITEDSYVEYDMDEVYAEFGNDLFNVKYVNDDTIALIGGERCLLYDVNKQKVIKSLPYDWTMGCLKTQDQFLLYGKEIYSCLDAETMEEQEPEEGLQEFVQTMYEKNFNDVFPPMQAWKDTIVCMTKSGIYEYKDGETTYIRQLSSKVSKVFNGLLPICKVRDGEYYIAVFSGTGMSLWQIDGDKEEMK